MHLWVPSLSPFTRTSVRVPDGAVTKAFTLPGARGKTFRASTVNSVVDSRNTPVKRKHLTHWNRVTRTSTQRTVKDTRNGLRGKRSFMWINGFILANVYRHRQIYDSDYEVSEWTLTVNVQQWYTRNVVCQKDNKLSNEFCSMSKNWLISNRVQVLGDECALPFHGCKKKISVAKLIWMKLFWGHQLP